MCFIEMLDLKDTGIGSGGIKHLLTLEYPGELRLKEAINIDDLCLLYIGQITSLRLLQVNYTGITPKGFLHLTALRQLKTLFKLDKEVSEVSGALHAFKSALPGCEIVLNGKTYSPG